MPRRKREVTKKELSFIKEKAMYMREKDIHSLLNICSTTWQDIKSRQPEVQHAVDEGKANAGLFFGEMLMQHIKNGSLKALMFYGTHFLKIKPEPPELKAEDHGENDEWEIIEIG